MGTRKRLIKGRVWQEDEDPEREFIDPEAWSYGGCHFCGLEGHQEKECPNRP